MSNLNKHSNIKNKRLTAKDGQRIMCFVLVGVTLLGLVGSTLMAVA